MGFPMGRLERYLMAHLRWVKTELHGQCCKFWHQYQNELLTSCQANIQIIPIQFFSSLFFIFGIHWILRWSVHYILHWGSTWMQIERQSRLLWASTASIRKIRERRGDRSAVVGSRVCRASHLCGSSLVATLSYQGHLSVWALHFQFNHLRGQRETYSSPTQKMPKCDFETCL